MWRTALLAPALLTACSDSSDRRPAPDPVPPQADFSAADAWLEDFVERDYGGVVLFEEYTGISGQVGSRGVIEELVPLIEEALDAVR